jgi:hypothetical protein
MLNEESIQFPVGKQQSWMKSLISLIFCQKHVCHQLDHITFNISLYDICMTTCLAIDPILTKYVLDDHFRIGMTSH